MAKPKSPRSEARRRQTSNRANMDVDGSSEDEGSDSEQNDDRNYSHRNTSRMDYVKVSPRPNLSNYSDLNSSAETYKHTSRVNTSTSSDTDSPGGVMDRSTSKSPTLYPSLEEFQDFNESANSNEDKKSRKTFGCLLVTLVIIVIIYVYMSSNESVEPLNQPDDSVPPFHKFTEHISSLEQVLPNQNKRLWRTVKASAKHVLHDTDSDYPAVILMASPTKHAHIAKCIAKKIAENFERSLGISPVTSLADVGKIKDFDPPVQKKKLDEHLFSAFSEDQRKSFVIDNLQLLHPEAALILHGYCDNDNAPYKDVMMVLVMYVDGVVDYSSASVEGYLEQLWSQGLEVDKVKALLSRVANNIVTVEMEDEKTFSDVCS